MDVDNVPTTTATKPSKMIASFRSLPRKIRPAILAEAVVPDLRFACLHDSFGDIVCDGCLKETPFHLHFRHRKLRNAMSSVCCTLSALDEAQLPSECELDVVWVDTECNRLFAQYQMEKRLGGGWKVYDGEIVLYLAEWVWMEQSYAPRAEWVLRRYLV